MKDFIPIHFDHAECHRELLAFKALLDGKKELEEGADIKPFFESHRQLATLLGSFHWNNSGLDLLSFQYQLFGDFGCDLVVGDSVSKVYVFVEFEDATATTLFRRQGEKATPEWGTRFERAFSQIIDWFWKLDDMARTDDFEARFGRRHVDYSGLVVAGRDEWIGSPREQRRWQWRSEKVTVNGSPIRCATYDHVHRFLTAKLDAMYPFLLRKVGQEEQPPSPRE